MVAFVKGTRTQPQCGFSHKVLSILNEVRAPYEVVSSLAVVFPCPKFYSGRSWLSYIQKGCLLCDLDQSFLNLVAAGECIGRDIQPGVEGSNQVLQPMAHNSPGGNASADAQAENLLAGHVVALTF